MLYIVSTPIGNLKDITLRALEVLKAVDIIACEDTRHSKILLDAYAISKPLISYHSYSAKKRTAEIIQALKEGKNIALVSDGGTPGISDPGVGLVNAAIKENIPFSFIPGPTALVGALVLSGKPAHKFIFEGFLSNRTVSRKNRLEQLASFKRTIIFYESCHRILACLEDVQEVFGKDKEIAVARELTKKFEEVRRGEAGEILKYFSRSKPRGEFIVVI